MLKVVAGIFMIVLLLIASMAVAEEPIENLLRNGDFENELAEWVLNKGIRGSIALMEIDKKDVIEGKRAVHIDIDTAGADYHTVRIEQGGHLIKQNQEYTFSAWLKAEEERPGALVIWGATPQFQLDEQITIGTEWQEYFGFFDATIDGDVSISVRIGESDIDVWVDDVKFYEGEYVPTELDDQEQAVSPDDSKLATRWGSIKTQY